MGDSFWILGRKGSSGTKKRGFLEGGFAKMYTSLGYDAVSAEGTAGPNTPGYF